MRNLEYYPDPTAGKACYEPPPRQPVEYKPIPIRYKSITAPPRPPVKKSQNPNRKKIMYNTKPAYVSQK